MTTMCASLADVRPARRAPPRRRVASRLARIAANLAAALWAQPALAVCFPLAATQMTFTNYSPTTGAVATATVSYLCIGPTTSATVSISTPRRMTSGGNALGFELYEEAAHATVFPGAPAMPIDIVTSGTVTVYGLLPAQDAAPGTYAQNLTVTLMSDGNRGRTRLRVRATIVPTCTIQPGLLSFGSYDPLSGTPRTAQGSIVIQCTRTTGYMVGLGLGSNASGTTRQMANATYRLQYELYRQDGVVWNMTNRVGGTAPSSSPITLWVNGQVPAGQLVPAGSYDDVVQSTVEF